MALPIVAVLLLAGLGAPAPRPAYCPGAIAPDLAPRSPLGAPWPILARRLAARHGPVLKHTHSPAAATPMRRVVPPGRRVVRVGGTAVRCAPGNVPSAAAGDDDSAVQEVLEGAAMEIAAARAWLGRQVTRLLACFARCAADALEC
jgi:hypothetical protein